MKTRSLSICMTIMSLLMLTLSTALTSPHVLAAATSANPPPKTLTGYIPSAVSSGQAHLIGHHPGTDPLTLVFNLQLRNEQALQQFLNEVTNPHSPRYRHYMTLAETNQAFNPSPQQVQQLLSWLHLHRLSGSVGCQNNLLVDASGTFAQFEQLLHVRVNDYTLSEQGKHIEFYAPANEPSLDGSISGLVKSIVGLDNFPQFQADQATLHPNTNGNGNGSPPYYPQDFANAYDVNPLWNLNDTGSNQHIGVTFWGTPPSTSALAGFAGQTGAAPVNLQTILILQGHKGYYFNTLGGAEAGMDVEYTSGMAPGATIDYYQIPTDQYGHPLNPGIEQALCVAGTDNNDNQQISSSWGECERANAFTSAVENILETNTASGHDYLFSSGDTGSACVLDSNKPCSYTDPYPQYPASSAYVTSVGGTTFDGTINGSYPGEVAWKYTPSTCPTPPNPPTGSGGGFSKLFAQPGWQAGFSTNTHRGYPDVAADADAKTGALVWYDTNTGPVSAAVGGTSLAAPLWAGMIADVNQYVLSQGKSPLGFINPVLYEMSSGMPYPAYHDITSGTNGKYNAHKGWDAVTGLGSPDLYNLAQDAAGAGAALSGIAEVSATDVWAVGLYFSHGNQDTLIEHRNGSSWKAVPSPNPGQNGNFLNSVAAISATDVWAVGRYYDSKANQDTLIEHWNGSTWAVVPSPNPGQNGNYLNSVAAISATDVWAVGFYVDSKANQDTLIEHWNGSAWTVVPSPNPAGGLNVTNELLSVATVSATDVWAVGDYQDASGNYYTLIEQWNGSAWTVVPSPSPGSGSSAINQLVGVAAISAADVWAVGRYEGSNGYATLIEQWNGSAWTVVPSPSPGLAYEELSSVAAASSTDAWAVGGYTDSNGYQHTLIEYWNGTTWTVMSN